ncbi:type I secretion system permease/ATPase [Roseibacterium sp. SDUM158016]|uniref:type I secretion system permease/ATPase n=1 Tax=Roseicyclus sediminis TaxID=2980997 RepID=UPI0021CF2A3E|nr:type I secretion system permease/ATPase [Roseibacterium sp. SDUM158016]MCU4652492.1 type I secretion system permease/ATPase [Roseibacterium sp. SDUM158016]
MRVNGRARSGVGELSGFLRAQARVWLPAVVFGAAANILMLTGPLYMLQVYDRVLSSRSEETLAALSLIAAFLFVALGVLDHARGRILARLGARLQEAFDDRVFGAALDRGSRTAVGDAAQAPRDLATLRRALGSPLSVAALDLPWAPLFAALVFVFHPALGLLAASGAVLLVGLACLGQRLASAPLGEEERLTRRERQIAATLQAEAGLLRGLGMAAAARARWSTGRRAALEAAIRASDRQGNAAALSRMLRLMLQAALLGFGALLVLRGEITAGAVLAATILVGRALSPVEQVIGHWALGVEAAMAWRRLDRLLREVPQAAPRLGLSRPDACLEIAGLAVTPPGAARPALAGVSFRLTPGRVLGVAGPSGSGKSTLLRAAVGIWAPCAGRIRLGGAPLGLHDPDALGRHVGYLPQAARLFSGTVAENIARLDPSPDPGLVMAAAREAGAHEMILSLPRGYDTPLTASAPLSGGQVQLIALARAVYGQPVFLALDEPDAALDAEGAEALARMVRAARTARRAVLLSAHRPGAIWLCDDLLVLRDGRPVALGPTREVLRDIGALSVQPEDVPLRSAVR